LVVLKFMDILKESDDNIFIPRRTKEEKDKKLLFRDYRKIRDYIKNGSPSDLDFSGSPIEFLPKNLTQVNGDLRLIECENLKSLPSGLNIEGDLYLIRCKNLQSLPNGLKVKGHLYLTSSNINQLPQDLEFGRGIYLERTPIEKLPNNLTVNGDLDLEGCKNITSLPSGLKVSNTLNLFDNNINELPPDLEVYDRLILYGTPLSKLSRDKIKKMIPNVKGRILGVSNIY